MWDGTKWVRRRQKVWDGSQWRERNVRLWDGSAWRQAYSLYEEVILADGPMVYYRLDDADQQNKKDSSVNGLDLIASAGQVVPADPGALPNDLNRAAGSTSSGNLTLGTSAYNSVMVNDGSSPGISIEFWTWQSGAPAATHIMAQRATGTVTRQWAIYTAVPGYIGARLFGSQGGVNTALSTSSFATQLGTSSWHHVVFVYNSTIGCQAYIDGATAGVTVAYKGPLIVSNTSLGVNLQATTTVKFDEFAVYNYTLSPAQISAHYAAATAMSL